MLFLAPYIIKTLCQIEDLKFKEMTECLRIVDFTEFFS